MATSRLATLAGALRPGHTASGTRALTELVSEALGEGGTAETWLALAVLRAELPMADAVVAAGRVLRVQGPDALLRDILARSSRGRDVRVVTGTVLVDVHHTARTGLATGIQRVVRKTIELWSTEHEIMLVGWDSNYRGMRELSAPERENALYGSNPHAKKPSALELTIPWKSTYILPELAIESDRTARIAALAQYSGNQTRVIGFDCVPLTSADTIGAGMGAAFSRNLTAVAQMGRVATISIAASTEYEGWRTMLGSAGITGPEIREVVLPIDAESISDADIEAARPTLVHDDLPMVLCVGSHEPRKNHLAVLQAASQLWDAGREFTIVFIGGNSWGGTDFVEEVGRLREAGRVVTTITSVTDELLWSAYRLATCTVFPSLNEGYGLPVAESLAAGTPVVTSDFGSMREIAAQGGALLVSPRDDDGIAAAMETLLFDAEANEKLRTEARGITRRDWGDYAGDLWAYFMEAPMEAAKIQAHPEEHPEI